MTLYRALASLVLALGMLFFSGCYAKRPLNPGYTVRPGDRDVCVRACRTWGLRMSGMVVIANSTGCVCSAGPGAATAVQAGSLAASYHAVHVQEEEEAARSKGQQRKK